MKKVFSIYDSQTEAYNLPFFFMTTSEAIRAFQVACLEEKMLSAYAEHYSLFELGDFDTDKGQFNNLTAPKMVMGGLEARNMAKERQEKQTNV